MLADPLSAKLAGFVQDIGIPVHLADLPDPTFLPGIDIRFGELIVDEKRLLYPGDLLHEAGHVAVASPEERQLEKLDPQPGDEMATLAWSYAAARHLEISVEVVFHPDGYKGGADALIENFSAGRYVGVPLLQYYGMCYEPRLAAEEGVDPFPNMLRWLR
ncbi:hypothetical protein IG616_19495 [Labrenzia suaedae]|uniref:IrrE N-terminal-like domain-containing protein n=2 Tax=Roseibium litorale TaxID=2803841 RepID=A0ABR9CS82_9HYPH|nr:hypothetical protein [Roseibium litorale]